MVSPFEDVDIRIGKYLPDTTDPLPRFAIAATMDHRYRNFIALQLLRPHFQFDDTANFGLEPRRPNATIRMVDFAGLDCQLAGRTRRSRYQLA